MSIRVFITGICGFVGSSIASAVSDRGHDWQVVGMDNLSRKGSERNRSHLAARGVSVLHGDFRAPSDLDAVTGVDWVIHAASNPSVLAGLDGPGGSRRIVNNNLNSTLNVLEFCKRENAGLILLSSSRVYSIPPLAELELTVSDHAFSPRLPLPVGMKESGIGESFPTTPPVSLYGSCKRASEQLALEYAAAFDFPCWVNRCGILAGAGQFARPDQGIVAFWIHSRQSRRQLKFIGFDGSGHQVRDCLHPRDLLALIERQIQSPQSSAPKVVNVSGGIESAFSLRQLDDWCDGRFGPQPTASEAGNRPFDLPWIVLDHSLAKQTWDWKPVISKEEIFEEIASHAERHPDWLSHSI